MKYDLRWAVCKVYFRVSLMAANCPIGDLEHSHHQSLSQITQPSLGIGRRRRRSPSCHGFKVCLASWQVKPPPCTVLFFDWIKEVGWLAVWLLHADSDSSAAGNVLVLTCFMLCVLPVSKGCFMTKASGRGRSIWLWSCAEDPKWSHGFKIALLAVVWTLALLS